MGKKLEGEWAVYVALEKIGRLSTVDPDGTPNTTPVFYALMDSEVYIGTQRTRKKFRNLVENPKVCFTIDTPESPYKGIMIQGTAEVIEDKETIAQWHEALMYRYYGHPDSPGWAYIQSLGAPGLVKINATDFFHWKFG